ncbi:unnamed protein product (macronuclear) [Paramecium tetraurelia]|uniref:Uncharacterized protein n=1 Tax=Paramecium tetraurelia TaxID=5888 RepID=A0DVA8_PARTE|nr:uncharacterized protein GSPATT00020639001 [Paramecium tetraurelia]CAK86975.1 unnamed protein product [Paramecium tetraurelia]|eukprot:XP_001454372.1 hypothetical protein (macronuclear) [Paramecium tetraurelia strain d4-2]
MYQKHSQDLVICKDNRSTQSAHKCRGGDSPQKLYQNLTHKNSNQSKDIHLLQNNQMRPTHYLQTSIDVHELNRSQKARHSHQRIKTEIDRSMDLNKRIYPKVLSVLLHKIEIPRNNQNALEKISTKQLNQIKEVQRDIQDSHHKYFFQPDIKPQLSIKANNYLKINPQANFQDSTLDDLSQIHHQQNKLNDIRRNTNPNQLKKSLFQQIQDFNLIRFDQIHLAKEEDYMKFSFGFQYNQVRSTKKFPKDVFYNDVRKAKKNLSMQ